MKTGYIDTNGLRMYYQEAGEGRPLVLLHGAFSGAQSSFGDYQAELAEERRVIALEMQGPAHTADLDRPLRVPPMPQVVDGALPRLDLRQAALLGYRVGGARALDLG